MTFFYDLNKRLATLATKQDAEQLAEHTTPAQQPKKGSLAQALNERDLGKHNNATTGFAALAKKTGGGEKGARIAGAQLAKMRAKGQVEESHCPSCDCSPCECDTMEESAFQAAIGKKKYGDQGMKALQKAGREHASDKTMDNIRNRYDKYDESQGIADEGNAFTGKLASTPKGGKFKLGDKEFKDTSSIEEGSMKHQMHKDAERMSREKFCSKYGDEHGEFWDNCMGNLDEGFKEMDAWLASREKEKGTGKFDKKERTLPGGMKATTYTRKHEDDEEDDKDAPEAKGGAPKKKGRPQSAAPKDQERVTKGSHKYKTVDGKRVKKEKTKEGLDSDSVMMTRPTNCSSESIEHGEQAEYNDEAGMTKDSLHTIVRHAKELESALRDNENLPEWVQEKIGQIKGMMSSVTDYIISTHERDAEQQVMPEVAPPGAKAERMVKGIKKSLSKDGHLSGKDKAIAYATTWKAKKDGKVEEAGKPDFLDLDKDGDKKEPMKKAAKDKKEEKVDETTVAGSVATAPDATKKSSGGYNFGGGVYEGFNTQVESMITEGMNITVNMTAGEDGESHKSITVSAEGEEADQLATLLKMAGLQGPAGETCGTCGNTPCGCEQTVDEAYGDTDETLNDPDWPTDQETLAAQPELRTYSGGLNGPKSTGQTTVPVVASQERRLHSESVELERSLFKTWKNYKG